MTTSDAVLALLERLFRQKLPADLSVPRSQVAGWDSLAHLDMILALEEAFDVRFEIEEIERMNSVQSILDMLTAKRADG
jgi:acyl carrier protein